MRLQQLSPASQQCSLSTKGEGRRTLGIGDLPLQLIYGQKCEQKQDYLSVRVYVVAVPLYYQPVF